MSIQNVVSDNSEPNSVIKFLSINDIQVLMDVGFNTAFKRRKLVAKHFDKSPMNVTRRDINEYYKL